MGNNGKLNILYGEGDQAFAQTQAAAMQKAGHQVETMIGRKAVLAALQGNKWDLVVLGSTLTRDDRHHIPYMVKKADANMRVLVLHADGGRHHYVDANVDTGSSVETLVAKIAEMIGQTQTKAAAASR